MTEALIFEKSRQSRQGVDAPSLDVPGKKLEDVLPAEFLRQDIPIGLPEVSEPEAVRHYTRLSQMNYAIDIGMYPLGSCTMKYNPRSHEDIARLPGFADLHPLTPEEYSQGALKAMWHLEKMLARITGMCAVTLLPAAGAHGELTGLMMVRAALEERGENRTKVLIPDSAHGTNPASAAMCGYRAETIKTGRRGILELGPIYKAMDTNVAALMLTNPNTLGLFEKDILAIADVVHKKGGFIYCDGANLNALLGIAKPGQMDVDVLQINLHKTFSTPHGGGGPGAGPVGVAKTLEPFLPIPRIEKKGKRFTLTNDKPKSIGRIGSFYGNFLVLLRAYAYILTWGNRIREISETAVLNANYLLSLLKDAYHAPYPARCMHEFVLTDEKQHAFDVHTLDIAKRLADYGFHAPTIYFPLIVEHALMIEPTETESKETLDAFAAAMLAIADEAARDAQILYDAPHKTPVRRLDEYEANKNPDLRWKPKN